MSRNPHPTKKGPGRRHAEVAHPAPEKPQKGTPAGFVQRINPERSKVRARLVESGGRRQALKQIKAMRRLAAEQVPA